ncbi:fatty acyl-CoA reductase wat-like [Lycorma delicatula]|uniref:fatty acyl-CoA reductase wat-like n=1 Tax=Lycorma delicatula TaxID=130591 RepID=UPI003F512254
MLFLMKKFFGDVWPDNKELNKRLRYKSLRLISRTFEILTGKFELSKEKAFVYVSTAYSNCHLNKIEEKFYISTIDDNKLITLTECLNNQQLKNLTP